MANLFQKLQIDAFRAGITPRTKESQNWFRRKVQGLAIPNNLSLMGQEPLKLRSRTGVGSMYMYFYVCSVERCHDGSREEDASLRMNC